MLHRWAREDFPASGVTKILVRSSSEPFRCPFLMRGSKRGMERERIAEGRVRERIDGIDGIDIRIGNLIRVCLMIRMV